MLSQNMNVTLRRLRLGCNPGITTAEKAFMGAKYVKVAVHEVKPEEEEDEAAAEEEEEDGLLTH